MARLPRLGLALLLTFVFVFLPAPLIAAASDEGARQESASEESSRSESSSEAPGGEVQKEAPEREASAEDVSPNAAEVQAYQSQFNTSPGVATSRLEVQHLGAGIVRQLEAIEGQNYAGAWFNNESGRFVVPLVAGTDPQLVATSLDDAHLAGDYELASASYSWRALEAAQVQIDRELASPMEEQSVSTSLDPRINAVVIELSEAAGNVAAQSVAQAEQSAAVAVRREVVKPQSLRVAPAACNASIFSCDKLLRGGVRIDPYKSGEARCTTAFKATAGANNYMLTAGHCNDSEWVAYDSGGTYHVIGPQVLRQFGPSDWELIQVSGHSSWWEEGVSYWPPEIVEWGSTENAGMAYEAATYVGEMVCHSGEKTGTSCATVVREDKSFTYVEGTFVAHMTEAEGSGLVVDHGDSGGPVYSGVVALGITSGGHLESPYSLIFTEITRDTSEAGVEVAPRIGSAPWAETLTPTGVGAHEIIGYAKVRPNGLPTTYHFFVQDPEGKVTWSPLVEAGSGYEASYVGATITGLTGNTNYTYKVVALNTNGYSEGGWKEVLTSKAPPAVTTNEPTNVGPTSATLNGSVGPEHLATTYYFEYGSAEGVYEHKTETKSAGSGYTTVAESAGLTGLEFGSTVHYRIVATNEKGTSTGQDKHFTPGWFLESNPKPEKAENDILESVSCLSPADCTGVGNYTNGSGVRVILAEHWNGTSWELQASENPAGASSSQLDAISCASSAACIAVGSYRNSAGSYVTLAERWNGTKWEIQSTENPTGTERSFLDGVSCESSTECTAVGYDLVKTGIYENDKTLAERWNGTKWEIQSTPNPEPEGGTPHYEQSNLVGVSCTSATACTAIGTHQSYIKETDIQEALAEHWNGTKWEVQTVPLPAGESDSWFEGVSCTAATECTAVGHTSNGLSSESTWKSLAERLTGTKWTVESTPSQSGINTYVYGVSCASSTFCMAFGTNGFAMRWKGSSWELQYPPIPSGEPELIFGRGVSCTSSTACIAIGSYRNGSTHYLGSFSDFFAKTLPPKVTTTVATGISETEATLKGTVNPNGASATYHFEYGTTTSYGTSIPIPSESVGAGSEPVAKSNVVTGLRPETVYHYRMVASNECEGGKECTTKGTDSTFTTLAATATHDATFGKVGSGNGEFEYPIGIAVDQSRNVWVVDSLDNRVEKFNEKGEYLSQFGTKGTGNGQFNEPISIAVTSSGNLWITDSGNDHVQEFNSKGEYLAQFGSYGSGNGQFNEPFGIAIAPDGHIWVSDIRNERVEEFTSSGEYVREEHGTGHGGSGNGEFAYPAGLATDANGDVWVADAENNRVQELSPTGAYLSKFGTKGVGNGQFEEPYAIAIKSSGNLLVVDSANKRVEELTSTGEYLGKFGSSSSLWYPEGIALGAGGTDFIANTADRNVQKWNQPWTPEATTQAASSVTPTGATINGTADPAGLATTYHFEYGTTTSYGTSVPVPSESVGSGIEPVTKNQVLTGLAAKTTYHYRIVATNSYGTTNGKDGVFKTPPAFDFAIGSSGSTGGKLSSPMGVAVDSSGNVWVADKGNNRVGEFNEKGEFIETFGKEVNKTKVEAKGTEAEQNLCTAASGNVCQAGKAGSANGQLGDPLGITITSGGNLWVTEGEPNDSVQEFNTKGEYLAKFGSEGFSEAHFFEPYGIAIGSEGHIWVADELYYGVKEFTSTGGFIRYVHGKENGGDGNGEFWGPTGLATDSKGDVWADDSGNKRVQELSPNGEYLAQFATESEPSGVAVESSGNLLVSNGNQVQEFTPGGEFLTKLTGGSLSYPQGIAVGPGGVIYVANTSNGKLDKWG